MAVSVVSIHSAPLLFSSRVLSNATGVPEKGPQPALWGLSWACSSISSTAILSRAPARHPRAISRDKLGDVLTREYPLRLDLGRGDNRAHFESQNH